MATYRRRILEIAGCLLVLSPVSALADEPAETALKNLVASLDASPDWTATYQGIAYDPATGTATLTGLSVKGEHSPTHFDFATVSVSGYSETPDGGFAAMERLIDRFPSITAVFCENDHMAIGAIKALERRGRRVPGDVAVVGCDDIDLAPFSRPALTTIKMSFDVCGARAVDVLLDHLATGDPMPEHVVVPVELIVRESCGAQSP